MKGQTLKSRFNDLPTVLLSCVYTAMLGNASAEPSNEPLKLLPPYGELPPTFWEQYGIGIIVAAPGVVAVIAFVVWLSLRPKLIVPEPPDVRARRELSALMNKPEDGVLLSSVTQNLRRYVIVAFELPVGESTTTEFRCALMQNDKCDSEFSSALLDFLDDCDRRKFAPQSPGQPMGAASRALQLVGLGEARLSQLRDRGAAQPTTHSPARA